MRKERDARQRMSVPANGFCHQTRQPPTAVLHGGVLMVKAVHQKPACGVVCGGNDERKIKIQTNKPQEVSSPAFALFREVKL
jgi:hypothetical protein